MPKAEEGENDLALNADLSVAALFGCKGKVALVTGGGSGIGETPLAPAAASHSPDSAANAARA